MNVEELLIIFTVILIVLIGFIVFTHITYIAEEPAMDYGHGSRQVRVLVIEPE